ncbi:hypothetical protein [Tetragenococcus halophilus]|uniref:Uncharacterized protein n=3 Tax=Tetragenococcus halophilus TaxID=51669 RepID=A0A2H6C1K6_TETHA|nr:hypothetical protein [Tetragenococcus halophilus]AOF49375.1 hypothetical protein AC806_08295 [Tetragenococcus halophilus]AYW51094.1 CsbD family protein [Tetragenococcus halophilus]MCF1601396.1 CsbD family protein [Tetragenococcus halophilus]MCF1676563.1 CsbD family protein [Tetragenococcus halophilus]MCO7026009.1 CsbD family protein [Tetragenococcus halophilus]
MSTNKDDLKGKFTEAKGKVTGDSTEELKGKAQQGLGKAKDKAQEAADKAADKVNEQVDEKKDESQDNDSGNNE